MEPAAAKEPRYKPDDVDRIVSAAAIKQDKIDHEQLFSASSDPEDRRRELLARSFGNAPDHGPGEFERLPMEIVIQIVLGLDLATCLAVRQTNRAVRDLVTSVPEYRTVVVCAFRVVDAVFEAGMASRVTVQDLYRLLCTHDCMICSRKDTSDSLRFFDSRAPKSKPKIAKGVNAVDVYRASLNAVLDDRDSKKSKRADGSAKEPPKRDPLLAGLATSRSSSSNSNSNSGAVHRDESCAGQYLFLPTMTRCCLPCLEESPRLNVVAVGRLCMAASLPLEKFAAVLCKPLRQGASERTGKTKTAESHKRASRGTVPQDAAARVLVEAGFPPRRAKTVLLESGYLGEYSWVEDIPARKQFVVRMPFWSPRDRELSCGYTCRGCGDAVDSMYRNLKVTLQYSSPLYGSKNAFVDHFRHCPEALKRWVHILPGGE